MNKQYKMHQPFMLGYNAKDLKSWSPETDKYAKYLRSRVPLANRIPSFPKTQANPSLSTAPQVMNLSADYNKEKVGVRYSNMFCSNLLKFWHYTDLYGAWHGLPVDGSSLDEPVYGTVNLPNPAYTDAAHKNGVLSLGCWFWPREEEVFADLVEQKPDGSFPVADKMIEMALYFGFDGYFINQEDTISEEDSHQLLAMIKYMRENAPEYFHLQWYDTIILNGKLRYQNQFNDQNDPWIQASDGTKVIDSMFINYAWNEERLESSSEHAKSLDLDPYETVYASTENDKYGYNPPYDTRLIFPENGTPRASWGLFGTDFVWNRYENKFDPNDQDKVYQREIRYWSGPLEDPTDRVGRTLYQPYQDPFHDVDRENYRKWDGVAHYIPARSVIGAYPFVTRFNTGHGKSFFQNGKLASGNEWNHAGIQDILPSWQWWIQRFDADNQPVKEDRPVSERPLRPSFDYSTAYDGGSSLKVSGQLAANITTELRLFKTKLPVTKDTQFELTYNIRAKDVPSYLEVGVIFEEQPTEFVWLDVGNSTSADWQKKILSLQEYEGKTIATIGLRFTSDDTKEYQVHIGEIALTNGEISIPTEPTGFVVEQSYIEADEAELFLAWDFDESNVWYYNIYQIKSGGEKELIGRIYDEVYYVPSFKRLNQEAKSTLGLTAVGFDGTESNTTETSLAWPN